MFRNHLHHPPVDVDAFFRIAGADRNIPLSVFNDHITVIVDNIPYDSHIGNGNIGRRPVILIFDLNFRTNALVVVQYTDRADSIGIAEQVGKPDFFSFIFVQFFNLRCCRTVCAYTVPLEPDLAAAFPYQQPIYFQVGVRQVIDGNPGRAVSLQAATAIQIIGLYDNIAAADGNFRNFYIADGKAFGDINLV